MRSSTPFTSRSPCATARNNPSRGPGSRFGARPARKKQRFGFLLQKTDVWIFLLTNRERSCILSNRSVGAWCNGNTWVSKTFVEGSNPSAPARVGCLASCRWFTFFYARQPPLAARTSPSNSAAAPRSRRYIRSGCHCTPRKKGRDSCSTASITPSGARAHTRRTAASFTA